MGNFAEVSNLNQFVSNSTNSSATKRSILLSPHSVAWNLGGRKGERDFGSLCEPLVLHLLLILSY
jgi:hypothetical protein